MKHLESSHDDVGRLYDQIDEAIRLEVEDPIEYAITLRYLQRYIPEGVTVADVGVGGGSIVNYWPGAAVASTLLTSHNAC
jgi:ubiquinone/menaquinone biosynthesis C-methylase UbiE